MSELGFLLELLLNHKLPKDTKALLASRIKEVEERLSTFQPPQARPAPVQASHVAQQAPSMQAIMARNPDLVEPPPVRVEQVAQTPAALQAMQIRQDLINQSMSGNKNVSGGGTLAHKMRGNLKPQPK